MQDYSKLTIDSMIEQNPVLRERFYAIKSRSSGNTLLNKRFAGGSYRLKGANTPTSFSQYTAKYMLLDEVDRWKAEIGGDPIALAEGRISRVPGSKIVIVSSPTIAGASIIEREFAHGTQEHYTVPCTHCGHMQVLVFGPDSQFYKPTTDICNPPVIGGIAKGWLEFDKANCTWSAYHCESCNQLIDERDRALIMAAGKWKAFNPNYAFTDKGITRSFHFTEMIFLIETSWTHIAKQFLESKKTREKLRVWVNEKLGETFQDVQAESITAGTLHNRQEKYFEEENPVVPSKALIVTASIDPQVDRVEIQLTAFGPGEEAWELILHRIDGSPEFNPVWDEVERIINKPLMHESGVQLEILQTFVDMGYKQERTIDFVRRFQPHRRVFAIKGEKGNDFPIVGRPRETKDRSKWPYIPVGRTRSYRLLYDRLFRGSDADGRIHFNHRVPEDYFVQLANAKCTNEWKTGIPVEVWEAKDKNDREEAIDLWRYALASIRYLKVNWEKYAENFEKRIEEMKANRDNPNPETRNSKLVTKQERKPGWDPYKL